MKLTAKILMTIIVVICLLFVGAFIAGMYYGYHAPLKTK
ncbi:hypothetical protein Flavo103_30190 [Flavobacterium collinsii]|nr:hypothetical protein Flavo103_30190 [Flavobacterium collinsii]